MSKKVKKWSFWFRRKSHFALLAIGTLMVLLLFFNEDASLKLNMQYQEQIKELTREIRLCEDSAEWYRARREALYIDADALEHVVREEYHMQRSTEDVYLIK